MTKSKTKSAGSTVQADNVEQPVDRFWSAMAATSSGISGRTCKRLGRAATAMERMVRISRYTTQTGK